MPRNTINIIGSIVFMLGLVISNGWLNIPSISRGDAVWILTIGFVLSFIARTGNLKFIAALVFIFGLAINQQWLADIPQLQSPSLFKNSLWIMVGGYFVLSFSK